MKQKDCFIIKAISQKEMNEKGLTLDDVFGKDSFEKQPCLYRFGVIDEATNEIVYKTHKGLHDVTYDRAEKWCKKNLKDRGEIINIE